LFPVKTVFRKVGKKMKTALLIYWSKTGNTEKAVYGIKQGLEETGIQVTMKRPEEAEVIDYFDLDLVCVGAPSYSWHPPEPVTKCIKKKFAAYRQQGKVRCDVAYLGFNHFFTCLMLIRKLAWNIKIQRRIYF
jgi:flavorubredoxin